VLFYSVGATPEHQPQIYVESLRNAWTFVDVPLNLLPIISEPHDRVFESLKSIPNIHKKLLAFSTHTWPIRVVTFRERSERKLEAILIHVWRNTEDLIKVRWHGASTLDKRVTEISEDHKGKNNSIMLPMLPASWEWLDNGDWGVVDEVQEVFGGEIGHKCPPEE
jgi:hypothetical protein